jgi:hypothetical protein
MHSQPVKARTLVLASFVACTAACGGGGSDTPIDAPLIDMSTQPPSPLVGRWRELPVGSATPPATPAIITFETSGAMSWDLGGGIVERGMFSFTTDDKLVTAPFTGPATIAPYYLSAAHDRFMPQAVVPMGSVDGPVGTWHSEELVGADTFEHTVVMDADMSVTYTWKRPGGVAVYTGTWALDGANAITMTGVFDGGASPTPLKWQYVPGAAIGTQLFERATN